VTSTLEHVTVTIRHYIYLALYDIIIIIMMMMIMVHGGWSLVESPPVLANGGVENEACGGRGPKAPSVQSRE
jgi:hypothetical protein